MVVQFARPTVDSLDSAIFFRFSQPPRHISAFFPVKLSYVRVLVFQCEMSHARVSFSVLFERTASRARAGFSVTFQCTVSPAGGVKGEFALRDGPESPRN